MSRISIIPDDGSMVVDGIGAFFSYDIGSDINAVQWYGENGTVEYREIVGGQSMPTRVDDITSFSAYEYLIPQWEQAIVDAKVAACENNVGYHWDAASGTCVRDS